MARHKRWSLPNPTEDASLDEAPVVSVVERLFAADHAEQPITADLPVERIDPNPFQARREFPDIDELANAIRQLGFTSRLRVRPHPTEENRFQLVYGERRLRAAVAAELVCVPCEVVRTTDEQMVDIGLAENIQRRDLTPLEEAEALKALMEQRGYSQQQVAERLGKSRGYVQNRLDLLRTPEDVQQLLMHRPDSLKAALVIARLPDAEARRPLIEGFSTGKLSYQDVLAVASDKRQVGSRRATPSESIQSTTPIDATAVAPPRPTVLGRALTDDVPRLLAMLARWRQSVPRGSHGERQALAGFIRDTLMPQADALLAQLSNDATTVE
jgi:ParB family chromosome partitioning protein